MTLKIEHQQDPDAAIIKHIGKCLQLHNASITGFDDRTNLLLTGYDSNDILQAGLVGLMGWNWLFISMLWVSELYRHKGYGTKLLLEAETIAKINKCNGVFLDTMSFQAPDFYKKHGYKEFGRLENFPIGHSRLWLSKSL